jgi:hypothetical protein
MCNGSSTVPSYRPEVNGQAGGRPSGLEGEARRNARRISDCEFERKTATQPPPNRNIAAGPWTSDSIAETPLAVTRGQGVGKAETGGATMQRHERATTKVTRLTALVVSVLLVGVLALVAPTGVATATGDTAKDVVSTTRSYVETFYPLWFTHFQFQVAPHNKLIGPRTISPLYQGVVAINDDTLYASSPIDASGAAVTVTVPATPPAGYSVLLLDPYGNTYPSGILSRPAGDTTPKMVYRLVGPDDTSGDVPGYTTVHLPLKFMILIFRADKFTNGTDETAEARRFRANLAIDDVRTDIRPVAEFALPVKTIADTLIRVAPVTFLKQLQAAVADTSTTPPLSPQDQQLSDDFDALFGDGSNLGAAQRVQFALAARSAHTAILDNYVQSRGRTNWTHFTNIGQWGGNVVDRSSITEFCQFCNDISTAAYYHAFSDGHGAPLNGSNPNGYVMTFKPGNVSDGGAPDASRFWSVTAYTPNAIELIPNPINKYVVASYTRGLVKGRDGSISIYMSKTKPAGVPKANWLPVSTRTFNVMLRVYGVVPDSSVATNMYVPPPIEPR